ncbi:MAG: type II secretion system F family protein [Clostridia bacterium]|nr:type II secretion system F family protein [Clostridia bacterium]
MPFLPLYVYLILAALSVAGITAVLFTVLSANRSATLGRLEQVHDMAPVEEEDSEYRKPFSERILKPLYLGFTNRLSRLTPAAITRRYNELLIQAGLVGKYTPSRMIGLQLLLGVFVFGFLFIILPKSLEQRGLLMLTATLVAFFVPYLSLARQATTRLGQINRTLPDFLDILYVSVEAGLGFDMALRKTAEKTKGPLSTEILQALTEMSKGRDRKDALRGITERTKSSDLTTFINSVIQAEQLGSNIANTLRVQSLSMRQKRKQRAEEQAAKLATKMLFPIIFLIFPALLLILLGPSLIRLMTTMSGVF